jgi:hypothetical protein
MRRTLLPPAERNSTYANGLKMLFHWNSTNNVYGHLKHLYHHHQQQRHGLLTTCIDGAIFLILLRTLLTIFAAQLRTSFVVQNTLHDVESKDFRLC